MTSNAEDITDATAQHEAGHAVMRWLRGWPATEVGIDGAGAGHCAGTGRTVRSDDQLWVTLAGFAAESWCGVCGVDVLNSRTADFDKARGLLRDALWRLSMVDGRPAQLTVDEALVRRFESTCEMLWPYMELVERVAERLSAEGRLSARTVAAVCREFDRRTR
jgi:hypothetical protein